MIELPESTNLAKQIEDTFKGRVAAHIEAAHSPHGFAFYNYEAQEYPELFLGKALTEVNPVGGQVELVFEDMHLVFNDGVNIRHVAPDGALPEKHQFHLRFDDGASIVCTVQMYGGFLVYPHGRSDNFYYLVGLEKPSPLTDAFDKAYFDTLVSETDPKLSAKAFCATEQRIPGLGNGVLQDILFNARIHPQRKLKDLSDAERSSLFESVKSTLADMALQGGRDTEKNLFGKPGGYRTILSNKTKDLPCPECGGPIVRKAYLGGNVYFCPSCQPL